MFRTEGLGVSRHDGIFGMNCSCHQVRQSRRLVKIQVRQSRRLVNIVRGGRISRLKSINLGKASHARHTFFGVFNKGGVTFLLIA